MEKAVDIYLSRGRSRLWHLISGGDGDGKAKIYGGKANLFDLKPKINPYASQ